jgi:hypothetical protein
MDPMEKMDPESHEWGYVGRKFLAAKLWASTAAGPFIAAHLKSLMDYPLGDWLKQPELTSDWGGARERLIKSDGRRTARSSRCAGR